MKLKNASRYFDRTTARNAYNAAATFKCQLEPLDLFRTEGTRIKLRGMSTAPGVAIPSRRTIKIEDQIYLVSDGSGDQWNDAMLRARYVLQGADHVVEIRSVAQVLADDAGAQAYAAIEFGKVGTDERDNSVFHAQYHVFLGGAESVPDNAVIETLDRAYLVRNHYHTSAGLIDAMANELEQPYVYDASFGSRAYNPITDTYTDTPTTVRAINIRWQDHFAYLSQGSAKYERGDRQVLVPLSVTPKAGDTVAMGGVTWTVLSRLDLAEYRSLHVRRA